jgi:hypothetical protein
VLGLLLLLAGMLMRRASTRDRRLGAMPPS